jgi:hypothetical protein
LIEFKKTIKEIDINQVGVVRNPSVICPKIKIEIFKKIIQIIKKEKSNKIVITSVNLEKKMTDKKKKLKQYIHKGRILKKARR